MGAVYRGLTQAELEVQYNAQGTVADISPYIREYTELTAAAHRDLTVRADIAYGPQGDERLDFFPAGRNAPLLIFLHGGYWRALHRENSGFMAKPFVNSGVAVAVIEYTLAPEASLGEIVEQVRRSVAFLYENAGEFEIDRNRIFIAGSSAGAHLAAMLLAPGWHSAARVPENVISGALLASGLFDLEPVRLCLPNSWLSLTGEDAHRNSPIHFLPDPPCGMIIVWGGNETDEFKRQSRDYAKACRAAGLSCEAYEITDRNHFNIITDLADPDRDLTRQMLAMIG